MMKKPTFRIQLILILVILGLGHLLAHTLHTELPVSIAWMLCGILYILNPVYPEINRPVDPRKCVRLVRFAGAVIFLNGLLRCF